jgi:hypothetical protein
VTTTVTPAQLTGTTVSATVGVTTTPTVPVGTYTATIAATAQGVGNASATYQLTVTAAGDFALTVSPATLPIAAGSGGNASVNINRTNFTGAVTLALVNPAAGITGTFNQSPAPANTSTLAISVAASVAPGSYPLTIQGTATGLNPKTTTLTVTVTPPASGNNVEYQYCSAAEAPVFFAYQDGAGAWQRVNGVTAGGIVRFGFNLTQGRGGVIVVYRTTLAGALARRGGRTAALIRDRRLGRFGVAAARTRSANRAAAADVYNTQVLFGSTAEHAQEGLDNCLAAGPTKTIRATVAGVTAGNFAVLSLGGSSNIFIPGLSANPITFTEVPAGPVDFLATRTVPGQAPNRAVIFRALNIADGGSLPATVDFLGAASVATATAVVNITGGAGDDLEVYTELVTANGEGLLWNDLDPTPTATRPWGGLTAASMATGDFHGLVVFASRSNSPDFRLSIKFVGPVGNQNIALGPALSAPATSQVATGTYPRFRFQGTLPSEYNRGISIDLGSQVMFENYFNISGTGAYFASAGSGLAYDITMPDVAGIAGFPAAARISAGANDVAVVAFGSTGQGVFNLQPALGIEAKGATKVFTINVQ